eukprot:UN13519
MLSLCCLCSNSPCSPAEDENKRLDEEAAPQYSRIVVRDENLELHGEIACLLSRFPGPTVCSVHANSTSKQNTIRAGG